MTSVRSLGDRMFIGASYFLLSLFFLVVALPILNLLAVAISGQNAVNAGDVGLWPKHIQWHAFQYVASAPQFFHSLRISVLITVIGSVLGVFLAVGAAYPLSKPKLPGRKTIVLMYVFTMMFNGGIVPQYLLMHKLHLLNSIWAIIFPTVTNVFNLLIVKNFFENLPEEIEESAKIDGASPLVTLLRIMLPICRPVIATILLFYAVELWNEYFLARLYITDINIMPLQLYLRAVIFEAADPAGGFSLGNGSQLNLAPQSVINATVLLSMLPMILFYPFLQRHFVKGIVIGSVKG